MTHIHIQHEILNLAPLQIIVHITQTFVLGRKVKHTFGLVRVTDNLNNRSDIEEVSVFKLIINIIKILYS